MTHWLTPDGYNVMLRGLMGDAIKFTRIKYGNGTPGDGANDLKNPLLSLKIASATRSEKYVTLSVSFKKSWRSPASGQPKLAFTSRIPTIPRRNSAIASGRKQRSRKPIISTPTSSACLHRSTTLWCSSVRPKTCLRRSAKRWSTQPFRS